MRTTINLLDVGVTAANRASHIQSHLCGSPEVQQILDELSAKYAPPQSEQPREKIVVCHKVLRTILLANTPTAAAAPTASASSVRSRSPPAVNRQENTTTVAMPQAKAMPDKNIPVNPCFFEGLEDASFQGDPSRKTAGHKGGNDNDPQEDG